MVVIDVPSRQIGLLAETLLEAVTQDNGLTSSEVTRLREGTRAAKRKLAQARRERALKAMGIRTAEVAGASVTGVRFSPCFCVEYCTSDVLRYLRVKAAEVMLL